MTRPAPGTAAAVAKAEASWGLEPGEARQLPPLLTGLRDGAWLDRQQFPPLAWAVPEIVPEGLVLQIGAPKIGKSWMALAHGLAVAAGGVTLGTVKVGPSRPVLYLALEDGDRRLQDRCRRLLLEGEPIPERLDYLTRIPPEKPAEAVITAWLKLFPGGRPLVILDTLGKVMPPALPGESAYQRDYRIGSILHDLCDTHPGLTLLVNHHDRKAASADFVDSVSGTNGLAGAADAIIVVQRERLATDGLLKVTGRDVPEGEYALRFSDGYCWQLDGADLAEAAKRAQQAQATAQATAGLGDRSAEVVAAVQRHPEGTTPAEVAAEVRMDAHAARTYLARLVEAGRIARSGRGRYTPVASVASVASEGGDGDLPPERNTRNGSNTTLEGLDGALEHDAAAAEERRRGFAR
jgi:hypothetical protein